jgi:hypothetical protein
MGASSTDEENWRRVREIVEKIPDAKGRVYVTKDYTTADLKRDLLATIPRRRILRPIGDE